VRRSWLCKLGLHSLERLGRVQDGILKRCRRCGCGFLDVCGGEAFVSYTPEQLETLLEMVRINL
jgi:hypothetical protein